MDKEFLSIKAIEEITKEKTNTSKKKKRLIHLRIIFKFLSVSYTNKIKRQMTN